MLAGIKCPFYVLLGITTACTIIGYTLSTKVREHALQPESIFIVKSIIGSTTLLKTSASILIIGSLIVNATMWVTYFIAQHITT